VTWRFERKYSLRRPRWSGPRGQVETLPKEEQPEHPEFTLDEKTGLLLPEGARTKQHPPGFAAWEE
jgi:hypothetical protein